VAAQFANQNLIPGAVPLADAAGELVLRNKISIHSTLSNRMIKAQQIDVVTHERKLCPTCVRLLDVAMFRDPSICIECWNLKGVRPNERRPLPAKLRERSSRLERVYGITFSEYRKMYQAQAGKCAICETERPLSADRPLPFGVDHHHDTGQIRGLLCTNCNAGLGMFKDMIERFDNAKAYLERFK